MAPPAEIDGNMKYLPLVLKHAEFKPNYRAVADEAAISSANNAQKKFKKIVEYAGFALVNGAVVSSDGCGADPATPKKPRAKIAATTASKKREVKETEEEREGEDCEGNEDQEN